MSLNLFDLAIKNPFSRKARKKHDAKPESSFFDKKPGQVSNTSNIDRDRKITFYQAKRLGEAVGEELEKGNYPNKFKKEVIKFIAKIGSDARLFPDMDTVDIWYTDYYDLIQCAEYLGIGDPRLPHWPEESNVHYRYLELSKNELVGMFLSVMDTILDREETNSFSSISIDWDNEIKKITEKLEEIRQNSDSLPKLNI